ncbi:MAG: Zn-ribbon containing protein [Halodesulfurarchaeum sp.]
MPHQCTNCASVFPDGSKEMLSGCPDCGGNTFQYIPPGADPEQYEPESTDPPDPPISEDSVTGKVGRAASTVREYVNARREEEPVESETTEDTAPTPETDSGTDRAEASTGADSGASTESEKSPEDRAQASTRGEVADLSDLSDGSASETTGSGPTADRVTSPSTDSEGGTPESDSGRSESPGDPSGDSAGPPRENARVVDEPNEAATTDLETLRAELNDQFESIRIVEPGQYELNLMELYDREEHIIALREDGKYKIEVPDSWREGDDRP